MGIQMRKITEDEARRTALAIIEGLGRSDNFSVSTAYQAVAVSEIAEAILRAQRIGAHTGLTASEGCHELAVEYTEGWKRGVTETSHEAPDAKDADEVLKDRYQELMQA